MEPWDLPWSVIFPLVDSQERHPSQIYEAILEGFLLFLILNFVIKKLPYIKGKCAALFLIFYSIFRMLAEIFREPDLHIGYIFNLVSMGSLLSIFMFCIGVMICLRIKNESKRNSFDDNFINKNSTIKNLVIVLNKSVQ